MYNPFVTAKKALYPVVVVALVEATYAALKNAGIDVDRDILYKAALAGYAGLLALINFLKNRKK